MTPEEIQLENLKDKVRDLKAELGAFPVSPGLSDPTFFHGQVASSAKRILERMAALRLDLLLFLLGEEELRRLTR